MLTVKGGDTDSQYRANPGRQTLFGQEFYMTICIHALKDFN
jgi:hypothetical protein